MIAADSTALPLEGYSFAIADDETLMRLMLQRVIERAGGKVPVIASTADDLLEKIKEVTVDLICLDVRMPGQYDGLDAAGFIASRAETPVVIITAFSDAATIDRANECGVLAIISKPVDPPSVVRELEMLLKNAA